MGVVLAPANGAGAAAALVEAGACELYLGFRDDAWDAAFPHGAGVNRMSGFGAEANAFSFEGLLAEAARVRGTVAADGAPVRLHCTFNAAVYTSEQVRFIEQRYLPSLAEAGFAGVIVSGPQLVGPAAACGLRAVASTMCAVVNADVAAFYRRAGAGRVIVPRDLDTADVAALMAAEPGLAFEVFLMRNGCVFADSHCMGQHCAGRPSLCRSLREGRREVRFATWEAAGDAVAAGEREWGNALFRDVFHESTCGLCALWRFERLGVETYKVVGRGDALGDLCADVALTARNIELAGECATEAEYLERMERPDGIRGLCATRGLSCYYPEVRWA